MVMGVMDRGQKSGGEDDTNWFVGFLVLAMIIGVCAWLIICGDSVVGTWRQEGWEGLGGTVTFEKDGHGYIEATGGERYDFVYEAEDGKLVIRLLVNGYIDTEEKSFLYERKWKTLNLKEAETGAEAVLKKVS